MSKTNALAASLRKKFGEKTDVLAISVRQEIGEHALIIRREVAEKFEEAERHSGVLHEDVLHRIDLVVEGYQALHQRIDGMEPRMEHEFVETRALIQLSYRQLQDRVETLEQRVWIIDETEWTALNVDVKAAAFEGPLEKAAGEGKKGADKYFTPRILIQSIVRCMKPDPRALRNSLSAILAAGRGAPGGRSDEPKMPFLRAIRFVTC